MIATCIGCGAASNPFSFFISPTDKESFGYQFDQAQAAFDKGQLEQALAYAEIALRLNKESEKASLLYGFINLALAGADPFMLAKAMVGPSKAGSEKLIQSLFLEGSVLVGEGVVIDNALLEDQAPDSLSQLRDVIGLTDDELLAMATLDQEVPEFPLLIPKCVETVRGESERLKFLENAVLAACPFVDEGARVVEDYRQTCASTALPRRKSNEAHFLWAFGHLTEALAFNAILTYRGAKSPSEPTNLEQRLGKVKALGQENLNVFISAVSNLQKVIDRILPVEGNCGPGTPTSQLRATVTDLMAVERAFGRLPHVPPKILASLKKGLDNVTGAGASVSALRGNFTKKISEDLAAKIDEIASQKKLSTDEKEQLCAKAAAISAGNQAIPEACKKP